MKHKTDNTLWIVWSHERNQYWRQDGMGYTPNRAEAGRYSLDEAAVICRTANRHVGKEGAIEESMLPVIDSDSE